MRVKLRLRTGLIVSGKKLSRESLKTLARSGDMGQVALLKGNGAIAGHLEKFRMHGQHVVVCTAVFYGDVDKQEVRAICNASPTLNPHYF